MRKSLRFVTLFMLCLALGTSLLARPQAVLAGSTSDQELFSDAANPPVNAAASVPNMLRMRYVDFHPEALDAVNATAGSGASSIITLELFPDTLYTARLERSEATITGGTVYSGVLEGIPYSEVFLSIQGDVITGDIESPQGYYQVQYVGDGTHVVFQLDAAGFAEGADSLVPVITDPPQLFDAGPTTDDGSIIDVMVVYTPAVRIAWGGTAGIQSQITLQMSATNQSYANSQVNERMRLVYTNEVSYNDAATSNWGTILTQLTNTTDGVMDLVHTWRNTYGADLVVLLVARYEYCGMGWLMQNVNSNFAPYGFSLVSEDCITTGSYSMAHEMGHNMGAHHDRLNASGGGAYTYSYGYQAPNRAFRTVMAYNCSGGCPRVGYWSNPNVLYGGIPTGINSSATNGADNRLTLNNTAPTVAMFRDGVGPAYTPYSLSTSPVAENRVQLRWSIDPTYSNGYRIERTPNGLSDWQAIYASWSWVGMTQGEYIDNPGVCTPMRYRVRAYNGNGYSNPSNEVVSYPCLPNAPQILSGTAISQTQINLSWSYSGDTGDDFVIERSVDAGVTWPSSFTGIVGPTNYSDTTVACGTDYSYRMKSHSISGDSQYSNTFLAGSIPCTPVVSLTAVTLHRINASWTDASNNPNESYELERSPNGSSWTKIATLGANQRTWSDGPPGVILTCGTSYYYRVKAITPWGSIYSGSTVGAPKACAAPPAPLGLTTTRLSIVAIRLNWTDVLDDEDYYRIERSSNGTSDWNPIGSTGGADIVVYTDSTLAQNMTVYYRIVAVNAYGAATGSGVSGSTYPFGWFVPLIR